MADYSLFNNRVNAYGDTGRKRIVNIAKEDIAKNLYDHPNLRDVKIDGKYGKLVVISKDGTGNSLKDVKQILSLPSEIFNVGQYVEFSGATWLITQADRDSELYVDGKMTLAPNILRFQDSQGQIYSYPYFIEAATYSIDSSRNIVIQSSSARKIKTRLDNITRSFYIDKRFMGEAFNDIPQCWKVIDLDAEREKGLLIVTLDKSEYNPQTDNKILGVAEYFEPKDRSEEGLCKITVYGNSEIKTGGSNKRFTVEFFDSNGQVIQETDIEWFLMCENNTDKYYKFTFDKNEAFLSVEDKSFLIGDIVTIGVKNLLGVQDEIAIKVVGLI